MTINVASESSSAPRKVSVAWPAFAEKLTAVLEALEEDHFLIITRKQTSQYVQFAGQGSFGLRAETASNVYLPETERLGESQIASLVAAGWHPPTSGAESTPENDPDGSPNFFVDYDAPVPYGAVSDLIVPTLTEIFGVPHPGYLQYAAFDADGARVELPALGLKREEPSPPAQPAATLAQQVLETMKTLTGLADLELDARDKVSFRYNDRIVWVCPAEAAERVWIGSIIVYGVNSTPSLFGRLNEFNAESENPRLVVIEDTIMAMTDLPAKPFVADHLVAVWRSFCEGAKRAVAFLASDPDDESAVDDAMPSELVH